MPESIFFARSVRRTPYGELESEQVTEVALSPSARSTLELIGRQLDAGIFPRVKNGGIVAPSDPAIYSTLGEKRAHYDHREPRSRSSEGTQPPGTWRPRGQTPPWSRAAGPWPAGQAAPLVGAAAEPYQQVAVEELQRAYPGTMRWQDDDGLWLLAKSTPLGDLRQAAILLTAISYSQAMVRSWGFWSDSTSQAEWIGPRHTNFPDGSICAFFPDDGTWTFGDSLVELLDLYSVWAIRHLHLRHTGRWPGPQAPCHPHERLQEFVETEICGCGSRLSYGQCCRPRDLARNRVADAVQFALLTGGNIRTPPELVLKFMASRREHPPRIADVLPASRNSAHRHLELG